VQRHGLASGPALDLPRGDRAHHLGQARDLLAVEGRQHEPALGEVRVLVEQDHRVAADQRLEDARAVAGVQDLGGRREDLLDLVGIGQHHERRRPDEAHGEALAVARAAALEERHRPRPPAHRLQPSRSAWSCWQGRGGHMGSLPPPKRGTPVTGVPTSLASPNAMSYSRGSSWHSRR
jgi:hypothetical protein